MALILDGSGTITGASTLATTVVSPTFTSPTFTTPILGTPASGNLANCTGIPAPAALSTASGSAPSYSARAWVNFDGTGTPAIRASGNVSSITDNGTGDYTVNFTTAMPDANYAVQISGTDLGAVNDGYGVNGTPTTSSVRVVFAANGSAFDMSKSYVSIFR
jgi:hypothetical protein